MIESIHIQNFRCFEDLKLDGLGRVNLIGGMNNSGKTVLLEGVFVGIGQTPRVIVELKRVRYANQQIWQVEDRNTAWDDLFFNKDRTRKISISSTLNNKISCELEIGYASNIFQSFVGVDISYYHNNKEYFNGELFVSLNDNNEPQIKPKKKDESNRIEKGVLPIAFMVTKDFLEGQVLVRLFSQLEISGEVNFVLDGLKIIDNTIVDIKVVSLGVPSLYAKRDNEPLMPLELFGDAIRKLATLVIRIIKNKDGILLIDEIENGIHYNNQPKVWELIFKLAQKFNVQVFATTHSKEMAQAFNNVALQEGFEQDARYIEMARHYKTQRLIGTIMEMDILKHKLDYNKAFRGE